MAAIPESQAETRLLTAVLVILVTKMKDLGVKGPGNEAVATPRPRDERKARHSMVFRTEGQGQLFKVEKNRRIELASEFNLWWR